MNKSIVVGMFTCCVTVFAVMLPAHAQQINKKSLEHTQWYTAPHEVQIIDDRPVIRDFREGPSQSANDTIQLPSAPAGFAGSSPSSGAMGGAPASLPAGGLELGSPQTIKLAPVSSGPRMAPGMGGLPKSGFGSSNVPAGGIGPRGVLPNGSTTNRLGNSYHPSKSASASAPVSRTMSAPSQTRSQGNYSAPVQSYSGGYGSGSGPAFGASAARTESNVRGSLLKKQ